MFGRKRKREKEALKEEILELEKQVFDTISAELLENAKRIAELQDIVLNLQDQVLDLSKVVQELTRIQLDKAKDRSDEPKCDCCYDNKPCTCNKEKVKDG